MKSRRKIVLGVVVVALLVILGTSGAVVANPPPEEPGAGFTLGGTVSSLPLGDTGADVTPGAEVASKISYQGYLTDAEGNPVNGTVDMVFQLWDDATGGSQVGGNIVKNDVPVEDGSFEVKVEVPQEEFNGQALWLRVQVDGEWLDPRQELLPVPYALSLKPGAEISGSSGGAVLSVINTGSGHGVWGVAQGNDAHGVVGWGLGSSGQGVYGTSNGSEGIGVLGTATNDGDVQNYGGYFRAAGDRGVGVYAEASGPNSYAGEFVGDVDVSGNLEAMDLRLWGRLDAHAAYTGMLHAEVTSLGGWTQAVEGVVNTADHGAGVLGAGYGPYAQGVHGYSTGSDGYGIFGEVDGANAVAVRGLAVGTNGIGGYFTSYSGYGLLVEGISKFELPSGSWSFSTPGGWPGLIGYSINGHRRELAIKDDLMYLAVSNSSSPPAVTNGIVIKETGNVGIGKYPSSKLDVSGTTKTEVLQITGGSDIAEPFDIEATGAIEPGMVLTIDSENPGKLEISEKAYDRCVAGIVSGAGGIQPGMIMGQSGTLAAGEYPVALTGRVYCWADASNGPIAPGDLLTTSDTPGHAMKVTDYAKAQGAILGKAMSSLEEGKGLVLVLVTLQ